MKNGLRYVYTGNVHDPKGGSTYCAKCGELLIGRDWYDITASNLTFAGNHKGDCKACGEPLPGVFDGPPGDWGRKRLPLRLGRGG